ncbi:MAG: SMP-30/gluconolactonase/LRE family protein [Pseudomonadota bacterium]
MSTIFEVRDPEFHAVIPKSANLETLVTGLKFGEGPIWHPFENELIFSDIIASVQYRWSEANGGSIFRRPSNMANGNAFDHHGNVLSCEHATSRVVRHDYSGKAVDTIASHFDGKTLNSPNDICCDADGRVYFTDPDFGRTRKDVGRPREVELSHRGVYCLDTSLANSPLRLGNSTFQQPNGLCLSPNDGALYVNDSADPCIRVFDVSGDEWTGGEVWSRVEGEAGPRPKWVPDGLKISNDGYVFCNGPGGVYVYAPDARCLGAILFPQKSTNFCFAGPTREELIVTTSTTVYRIATNTSGPPMIPGAPA